MATTQSCLEEKSRSFFKIILPSIITNHELMFPRTFPKEFVQEMSNFAILKVPSGNIWNVTVKKGDNGEAWFKEGWQEFVENNSICPGYFLVFKYDGNSLFNSRFRVLIFDLSCTEIEYPGDCNILVEANQDEDNLVPERVEYVEKSVPISKVKTELEIFPLVPDPLKIVPPAFRSNKKKRVKRPQSQPPKKKSKQEDSAIFKKKKSVKRVSDAVQLQDSQPFKAKRKQVYKINLAGNPNVLDLAVKNRGGVTAGLQGYIKSKAFALHTFINVPEGFKSEKPFFIVVMQQTYVTRKYALNVSYHFMQAYLKKEPYEVLLSLSDGRKWSTQCHFYNQGIAKLYTGWINFAKDNDLKIGDKCAFEVRGLEEMATASAALSSATFTSVGVPSLRTKRNIVYVTGLNSFGGLKAYNNVASLGVPVCADQSFAKIVSSLKKTSGRGGGALSSTCNAAAEIFQIAVTMCGLTLVGVAVGFVLLRIESFVEEAE
ncbi:hypothetical protein GIB67_007079 [Kingdonia uniflora]|uniref:TF-B3 domain-containing protein n=1 Tax=Kingdonia uniflora TaxID=39325 RepID=A0A7J7NZE8_9MAGN|nr:hypothetical protein GIB67_007079 [Kingdonia uniflora]